MTVITISRQFGSNGSLIAKQVAAVMGFHLADKHTMEDILRQYGMVQFERVFEEAPSFWDLFDEQYILTADMLDRTIKALAQHGDIVIVGRGSYAPLQGLADVLNVRIQAPLAMRIQRIAERYGVSPLDAEARVRDEDKVRQGFIEKAYKVRSDDATPFDLVVDTGNLAPELSINLIVQAARDKSLHAPDDQPRAAGFEVDKVLAKVIREVLACEVKHQ
jgi:cytidylate kinase